MLETLIHDVNGKKYAFYYRLHEGEKTVVGMVYNNILHILPTIAQAREVKWLTAKAKFKYGIGRVVNLDGFLVTFSKVSNKLLELKVMKDGNDVTRDFIDKLVNGGFHETNEIERPATQ